MSFEQLRGVDPESFDELAKKWERLAGELSSTGTDLKAATGRIEDWTGDAADTARDHIGDVRGGFATAVEHIERIPGVLRTLSDAISEAQETVNRIVEAAESTQYLTVESDGTVRAVSDGPQDARSDEEQRANAERAEEMTQVVTSTLQQVSEADRTARDALEEAAPDAAGLQLEVTGDGHVLGKSDIPHDASPQDVKDWWDSLSPTEQESAIYNHPELIGGMDGVPVAARDRANRSTIVDEYADLVARREELDAMGDERHEGQDRELEQVTQAIRGLDSINERLEDDSLETYLIDYSTEDSGTSVVATGGNPDTADNVITSVPGTGSHIGNVGGEFGKADAILGAVETTERGSDTVHITWQGYDAPPTLDEAVGSGRAEDAAGDLLSFQDGLRATHEDGGSHNTLIGHSYGSTAVGHAAQEGTLNVDNVVAIGSPGMGVRSLDEFNLPEGTDVYAGTTENDIIKGTPPFIHGIQPRSMDGVIEFDAGEGDSGGFLGKSDTAHSQYWDENSESLNNLAKIVVGQSPSTP
ncbi:alpha/beta hydrolase [Saccharomonospora sp. CUA-673]|nr:alpha/beta hydrolase [Saccharomonospora sp. CUA-673]